MKIELIGPVYPVSLPAVKAFTEIFNSLQAAHNVMELDYILWILNQRKHEASIAGYFKWNYEKNTFNLWQRISYCSQGCFPVQLLKVNFSEIGNSENRTFIFD